MRNKKNRTIRRFDPAKPVTLYHFVKRPPHVLRKQPKNFSHYTMQKYQPEVKFILPFWNDDGTINKKMYSHKWFRRWMEERYSGLKDGWYILMGRSETTYYCRPHGRWYTSPVGVYKFRMRSGYIVEIKTRSHTNKYRKGEWWYTKKGTLTQHDFALPALWKENMRRIRNQKKASSSSSQPSS